MGKRGLGSGKTAEKRQWILEYLRTHVGGVSAVDSDFQEAFFQRFKVARTVKLWGAQPCPDAQVILSGMEKAGLLERNRTGLTEMGAGWPNWIYVYDIRKPRDRKAI